MSDNMDMPECSDEEFLEYSHSIWEEVREAILKKRITRISLATTPPAGVWKQGQLVEIDGKLFKILSILGKKMLVERHVP